MLGSGLELLGNCKKMRNVQTRERAANDVQSELAEALKLLDQALQILDHANVPAEIGARLDHVICSVAELASG